MRVFKQKQLKIKAQAENTHKKIALEATKRTFAIMTTRHFDI